MELKTALKPTIALDARLYNASDNGEWIDLLDARLNKANSGIGVINRETESNELESVNKIRLNFNSRSHVIYRNIKIIINGQEIIASRLFDVMQFQRDILEINVLGVRELKIFLPAQTYSVDVTGYTHISGLDILSVKEQYCILVKSNSRSVQEDFNLLNPNSFRYSKTDFIKSNLYYEDRPEFFKYLKIESNDTVFLRKKLKIMADGSADYSDSRIGCLETRQDPMQFDDKSILVDVSKMKFSDLQEILFDVQPNEETLFYFYN